MQQLQGHEDLPWDGEQNSVARRKLGMFRQNIMSLLKRSSLAALCNACQQVFLSTATVTSYVPPRYVPE